MRTVEPSPWSLGVRLKDEPEGAQRLIVASGSAAEGRTIDEVSQLPGAPWVCFVVRDGALVADRDELRLAAGDEVLVLADGEHQQLSASFDPPPL